MPSITVKLIKYLKGSIDIPGDKSITHRAMILSSLADGETLIKDFLKSEDCLNTLSALRLMGVEPIFQDKDLYISGVGLNGLREPKELINLGNSGTSMRLLLGFLSAQGFFTVLTGDDSLKSRPMKRVIEPLSLMGGKIYGRDDNNFAPLAVVGNPKLKGINYKAPLASAQVKSAVLLAGLYALVSTSYTEPIPSRDHSEKMLSYFGAEIKKEGLTTTIKKASYLRSPQVINIPRDISSASFFIVLATLISNSFLYIPNLGLNPNRTGILAVLSKMGASIEILNFHEECGEPVGDLKIIGSEKLKSVTLDYEIIPQIIDEIPIIALAACLAQGTTKITGASELRVKESDRIKTTVSELNKLGAKIKELEDGLLIEGVNFLVGNKVTSHGDHRIAMTLIIAGLVSRGETTVEDIECLNTSFPQFTKILFDLVQI
ncbi:MAG: 3-phosphoshikimate 1-carboxyvinyltransferase [bacterium]|nr:3-phosphoshikimate 1-carboxyvinyltransferase [bacterium]